MEQLDIENNAYIHSVESFGTVDGPGIRYVIFLQGCILKCKYCHNRDTWDFNTGKIMNVKSIIDEILKYKSYLDASHGGVTVSGGEPLVQAKFLITLFKKLHSLGIHTTLDTSGSLPLTSDIKEVLKYTDLVLLDIKHINNEKCIELTSRPNTNTLNFAKYLNENHIPVWIRQVLVPGITDDYNDLLELKHFVSTLDNVKKIEFLPYHNMGIFKWKNLNEQYPLENVRNANSDDVKRANEIFRNIMMSNFLNLHIYLI